jgi:hypothetical protein
MREAIPKHEQARAIVDIFDEMRDTMLSKLDDIPSTYDAVDLHILARFVTDSLLIPEKEVSVEHREELFKTFFDKGLDCMNGVPQAVCGHATSVSGGKHPLAVVRFAHGACAVQAIFTTAVQPHEAVVVRGPHGENPLGYRHKL